LCLLDSCVYWSWFVSRITQTSTDNVVLLYYIMCYLYLVLCWWCWAIKNQESNQAIDLFVDWYVLLSFGLYWSVLLIVLELWLGYIWIQISVLLARALCPSCHGKLALDDNSDSRSRTPRRAYAERHRSLTNRTHLSRRTDGPWNLICFNKKKCPCVAPEKSYIPSY